MPPAPDSVRPVRTSAAAGDQRVHLFQVVDDPTKIPSAWVVVSIDDDGLRLATLDFEEARTVPADAPGLEPRTAGGVPVWGY